MARRIVCAKRCSQVPPGAFAIICASTSESVPVVNSIPRSSSSARSRSAFTTLPLCASARSPCGPVTTSGCMFIWTLEPVVE